MNNTSLDRSLLTTGQCPFCEEKTNVIRECTSCGIECFSSCSACREMGAPKIHAPRKMIEISNAGGSACMMCYPQCARKHAYKCKSCEKWHDKKGILSVIRQEGNISYCLCKRCASQKKVVVCTMCHAICNDQQEYKDKAGSRCRSCFARGLKYTTTKHENVKPVCADGQTRTFGFELEINNVHQSEALSEAIARLNFNGVRFSVVGDGSVHLGFEIISSPADKQATVYAATELFNIVRKFKHTYDNCGLHIHVADPRVDPISAVMYWIAYEDMIFSVLPMHRRATSYARPLGSVINRDTLKHLELSKDIEDLFELHVSRGSGMDSRYLALNMMSMAKHGTLEVRCMPAMTDIEYFVNFIDLIDKIWDKAKSRRPTAKACEEIMQSGSGLTGFLNKLDSLGCNKGQKYYFWRNKRFFDSGDYSSSSLWLPSSFEVDNSGHSVRTASELFFNESNLESQPAFTTSLSQPTPELRTPELRTPELPTPELPSLPPRFFSWGQDTLNQQTIMTTDASGIAR